MSTIKKITVKVAKKQATEETWRRTWRTFLQVFIATFVGGLAAVIPDWGTPAFRVGILVLVASAIGAALGAVMNLQEVVDPNSLDQEGEDKA